MKTDQTTTAPAAPVSIKVSYRVTGGGKLLTRENMARIRALDPRVNTTNVGPYTLPNYKNEYRLIHHPKKGYSWIEVYYGNGMSGWSKSIRACVINAARLGLSVVVDPAPVPARSAAPFFYSADRARLFGRASADGDWFEGATINILREAA